MPAFVTDHTLFLHVPKTGGTWVTSASLAAGVRATAPDAPHFAAAYSPDGHATLREVPEYADRFKVAFVRHPLDWWRSYWGHRMREGAWRSDVEIDRLAGHDDFGEFIGRVVERLPGYLSATYEQFVGTPGHEVDFIGRYERLADDLCSALTLAGERFDEGRLRAAPRVNINDYQRFPAYYEPRLAHALSRSEACAIERFYPQAPVPADLVVTDCRPRSAARARCAQSGPEATTTPLRSRAERDSRRLESALASLLDAERSLAALADQLDGAQRALAAERAAHEQTERSLRLLQGSRLVRLTRPVRTAYYRARGAVAHAARGAGPTV